MSLPIWRSIKSGHIIPFLDAQDELSLHFWTIPSISGLSSSCLPSAEDGCAGLFREQCHTVSTRLLIEIIHIAMCIKFVVDICPVSM